MSEARRVTAEQIGSTYKPELKLYVCTDHDKAQNEAKVASVVLAYDKEQGKKLLDAALLTAGLRGFRMWHYQLHEIPLDKAMADVLNDGDY